MNILSIRNAHICVLLSIAHILFASEVVAAIGSASSNVGALAGKADVTNGAATYSVPIALPPGTAGMQPDISLQYNSLSGGGLLGVGWSIQGLSSITRCAQTLDQDEIRHGIDFSYDDRYCLDGQRLIAITGTDGGEGTKYRTEIGKNRVRGQ